MLEKIKTRFENDGEKSRLVLEVDGDTTLIDFQVDMIRNNQIPGVLSLELRRVDSNIQVQYDVTGKWRLKDLLDNKEFSGSEFVSLLEKFIQTIIGAEAYLLDITQFVLDEDHIFLDGNMEPRLLYLPIKGTQNIHSRFKDLLLQLVVYRARLKDQDSGPVLSGILNYLKRDDFNIYEFQKALRNLNKCAIDGPLNERPPSMQISFTKPAGPVSLGNLIPQENRKAPPTVSTPKAALNESEQPKVSQPPTDMAQFQTITEYKTKTRYKSSTVASIMIFQVVLAVGVMFGFRPVYAATEDITTAYAAMGLMVVCLDGLVLKNLLDSKNRIAFQVPVKTRKRGTSSPDREQSSQPQPVSPESFQVNFDKQFFSNAQLNIPQVATYDTELLAHARISYAGANDTVILTAQPAAPYLVRKGPIQEIIRLRSSALVIGRQEDMADHIIDDPAIGRMHAELSWINNLCQIRDLNSKNGTSVNGIRLAGPHPVKLFIGDEIKLGPLEYTLAQD